MSNEVSNVATLIAEAPADAFADGLDAFISDVLERSTHLDLNPQY